MAFPLNEEVIRGDDYPLEFIFYDEASDGTLTPTDISLFNWHYTAKRSLSDADDDATIVLDTADMTLDADPDTTKNPTAVVNRLTLWLPSTITATMSGDYVHDLQSVEIASGRIQTRGIGQLTITDQVTQRTTA